MENATKKLATMAYRPLERTETLRGVSRASLEAHVKDLEMENTRLVKELELVKRERDAYFDSMKGMCATCKRAKYCMLNPLPSCDSWQWRGVKMDLEVRDG